MQPAICIRVEGRPKADDYFRRLRGRHDRLQGWGAVRAAVFWFLVSLLVLFVLFAYRPAYPWGVLPIRFEESAGEAASPRKMSNWENSATLAFRDYIGRVVGAVSPDCAVIKATVPVPKEANPPLLVTLLDRLLSKPATAPCEWRNSPWSFVVAFSPDVSLVQKVTLFVLVLGWVWLRRQAIEREIDLISFPRNLRHLDDQDLGKQDAGWAEHPVSRLDAGNRVHPEPLYPRRDIVLDPLAAGSSTQMVHDRLDRVSILLGGRKLSAPVDLLIDVLKAGAADGTKGAAAERMRSAVFEFKEKVFARLWPVDYLLWLLPTIGFMGTIYGISMSLASAKALFDSQAQFADQIGPVVDGLGVAFDTTAMALACAAILYQRLKRAEADSTDLAAAAEESLSNLFVARLVDRSMVALPPPAPPPGGEVGTEPESAGGEPAAAPDDSGGEARGG